MSNRFARDLSAFASKAPLPALPLATGARNEGFLVSNAVAGGTARTAGTDGTDGMNGTNGTNGWTGSFGLTALSPLPPNADGAAAVSADAGSMLPSASMTSAAREQTFMSSLPCAFPPFAPTVQRSALGACAGVSVAGGRGCGLSDTASALF